LLQVVIDTVTPRVHLLTVTAAAAADVS